MRILFLSSEVVPERAGGIATYTATIAPALADRGHEVHVLSCAPEHDNRDDFQGGVWWHRRRVVGGRRRIKRLRRTSLRLKTAVSCRKELRSIGDFDVIESPEWLAEGLLISTTTSVPVVVQLHTPVRIIASYDARARKLDRSISDQLERAGARAATAVTSTSDLLANELVASGWLRKKPSIIRYPLDVDSWPRGTGVGSGRRVLVVGRLEARKAPEVAVEAIGLLAEEIPDLQLTLIGRSSGFRDGNPYGKWLAGLAARTGAPVEFVSQMSNPEVRHRYAEARVVAVPSRFESFSIVALEAMAAGRPVVYSSRIGAAEIMRGTEAGREVPPNDPRALAEALRPYLIDVELAAHAGGIGRSIVERECRPNIIAAKRERCFEEAIARRKGS